MKLTDDNIGLFPLDEQHPREVTFSIIDSDFSNEIYPSVGNTGTLIEHDTHGIGLLTRIPLQPGNLVKFDHAGMSKVGIVMWSVESSDNFRIQVRYLQPDA